jgi:citrate synthase
MTVTHADHAALSPAHDAAAPGKAGLTLRHGSTVRGTALTAAGVAVYDPGFANTRACASAITFLDGAAGVLRYRGYDIAALADRASYPEVAFLLLYGELPDPRQLRAFDGALARRAAAPGVRSGSASIGVPAVVLDVIEALPRDAHPMTALAVAFAAMPAAYPHLNPSLAGPSVYKDNPRAREEAIYAVLGAFPPIAAAIYRRRRGLAPAAVALPAPTSPDAQLSYADRFLALLNGGAPPDGNAYSPQDAVITRALDVLLTLHADHELNCSTAALRQLSSGGVDVFTCVSGAIGALYGPLHGGATEAVLKMLERIGSVDAVPMFLDRVKGNRGEKLMGFGHRVYKNYDPRAKIVRRLAYQVFDAVGKVEPLIEVATALEKAALADDYFVQRKLYPNIDFYTGLIYKAVGFPTEFFPVLFALGRSAGWMAHWSEFLDDKDRRISRPQQLYVGRPLREFVELEDRSTSQKAPSRDELETPRTLARL